MSTATIHPDALAETEPATADAVAGDSPYFFSDEQFFRMVEANIFPREARVELWGGRIFEKMAKNRPHAVASNKALLGLMRALPPGWFPSSENPVAISPDKVPLPDLAIVRGRPDDYRHRNPEPADVGLIVEFADSSLKYDTREKLKAYARAGIPTYVVVNLVEGLIHVYTLPLRAEARYDSAITYKRGESFPFALGDFQIPLMAVDDLLPELD